MIIPTLCSEAFKIHADIHNPLKPGSKDLSSLLSCGQNMRCSMALLRLGNICKANEKDRAVWNLIRRLVSREDACHGYVRRAHLDETTCKTISQIPFLWKNKPNSDLSGKRFHAKILGSWQISSGLLDPSSNIGWCSQNSPKSYLHVTFLLLPVNTGCHSLCHHHTSGIGQRMLPPLPWSPDVAANAVATTTKMDSPLSLLLCFASSQLQVWGEHVQLSEQSHVGK